MKFITCFLLNSYAVKPDKLAGTSFLELVHISEHFCLLIGKVVCASVSISILTNLLSRAVLFCWETNQSGLCSNTRNCRTSVSPVGESNMGLVDAFGPDPSALIPWWNVNEGLGLGQRVFVRTPWSMVNPDWVKA